MACTMSSFPVPVSPSMRTVESVGATCSTWSRTDSRAALLPMIRSNLRSGWSPSGYLTVAYSGTEDLLSFDPIAQPCLSHIKCSSERFEQELIIQRFRQKLDCALSHRLNPRFGAPIACNKDDRNIALLLLEP